MLITPDQQSQIRGLVGRSSFDTWYADPTGALELQALWNSQPNAYLVASNILMSLADPSSEAAWRLGDASSDTKGQVSAWLAKAERYRSLGQAEQRRGARARNTSAGLIVGGVSVAENDQVEQDSSRYPPRFGRNLP